MNRRIRHLTAVLLLGLAGPVVAQSDAPEWWKRVVKVAGQAEPVPERWLQTEGGRHAHSLVLPDAVAKTVPFDFEKARLLAWLPWKPSVSAQYFQHLCDTEAGEWMFKVAPPQEGIFNARPLTPVTEDEAQAQFATEAPVLQREMVDVKDDANFADHFASDPAGPYLFVEEPHRSIGWQAQISTPFVRLFGRKYGSPMTGLTEAPMQLTGIDRPSARYGITWRGIRRTQDREHSVAGVELLVYDMQSNEILAVRRQFINGPPKGTHQDAARWMQGRVCARLAVSVTGKEYMNRLPMLVAPSVKKDLWRHPELKTPLPPAAAIQHRN